MILLASVCLAVLLGSIPTGLWMGRLKGVDIRQHGSGNVGATNVYRVVGKLPGVLVLAVDVAKGWAPVAVISPKAVAWGAGISPEAMEILLAMAAVFGHIWNPWLQFRGGRGVATGLGALLGLDPRVGWGAAGVWTATAWFSRYVSVSSIAAAFSAPFLMVILGLPNLWVVGTVAVSLAIIARHRPNILRLLHGEEPRIGSASPEGSPK